MQVTDDSHARGEKMPARDGLAETGSRRAHASSQGQVRSTKSVLSLHSCGSPHDLSAPSAPADGLFVLLWTNP